MKNQYLEILRYGRRLANNTVKSIENDLAQFGDNLIEATRANVERFVMEQNKQGLSTATVARRIASLKGFFEWQIYNEKRTGINPADGKLSPKVKNQSHQAISEEKLYALYTNAHDDVLKVAIALSGYAGLRIGEIVALGKTSKVFRDSEGHLAINLTKTKGDRPRQVTLALVPNEELIERYQNGLMGQRGRLSENGLWRKMRGYFDSQGMGDLSPHGLRATFASLLVAKGVRVDIVRDMLGHASLAGNEITSRYVSTNSVETQYQELTNIQQQRKEAKLCF